LTIAGRARLGATSRGDRRATGARALAPLAAACAALAALAAAAACGGAAGRAHAPPTAPPIALVDDGDLAALARALDGASSALARAGDRSARGGVANDSAADASAGGGRAHVLATLRELRATVAEAGGSREHLAALLAARFRAGPPNAVLLTGYYEPLVVVRRRRDARFRYPLYAPPAGDGPQPARADIERGALSGRGLELFWADDPIALFFLHVQGSGRLDLGDGSRVRVAYAGTNGRPYRSIGAVLVERGAFASAQEATAPAIEAWLRTHPDQAAGVMEENERFVFFRVIAASPSEGPPGALGAPLVPYRSVAVDPHAAPLGSVGLLVAELPDGGRLRQLVVAIDTGAAIRGAGRIDLFVGAGSGARDVAGLLRARAEIAWLAPRATSPLVPARDLEDRSR